MAHVITSPRDAIRRPLQNFTYKHIVCLRDDAIYSVMPARHEDTQDHGKQQLFHNLSSFPAWAPPLPLLIQRKACAFSHRRTKGNLQRISRITLMALNIKTIYARNIWILMLYSAFHMLNVNYLECGMLFNLCLIGYSMLFSFLNL